MASGLPDRGQRSWTYGLDEGREGLHPGQRQGHEAAVEGQAREPAARDAQPLRAADCRARDHGARVAGGRDCRRHLRRSLCHRRRQRRTALEEALREHVRAHRQDRLPHALPRRPDGGAGDGAGLARQVHDLCDRVGRPAAPDQRGRRSRRRPSRQVPAAQRQALRAERRQWRRLHGHGAGLRRRAERALLVRPGDPQGEHVPSRPAAACGDGAARRCRPKASSTW